LASEVRLLHPQALAVRAFRGRHGIDIATYTMAGSAKMVADGSPDAGAIASARAGEVFGLTALASRFRTSRDNASALPDDRPASADGRRTRQDVDRVFAAERACLLFKALSAFSSAAWMI
jgi:prephenate dehydratase